jgi:phage tail-like protein
LSTEAAENRRHLPPSPTGETLARHLPAIFGAEPDLCDLLGAFEEILLGPGEDGTPGLEQRIAALPELLDAEQLYHAGEGERREFLPWLAQWVALGEFQGLSHDELRQLIPGMVPLYARRGTKGYLLALLKLLAPEVQAEVDDRELPTLTVGESRIGRDTRLGGDVPFWFQVRLRPHSGALDQAQRARLSERVRAVTDLAKPAYTAYQLEWDASQQQAPE